jgi:hypothetical protein
MATFVWDPAVRWPPPANILLAYDVVPPDPPAASLKDGPNVLHTFSPIHDALRVSVVKDEASTEEKTPVPKVVIVGELYEQNVQVGGGPMPGGGGPVDPGYGRPDWGQGHPGNRPPGSWSGNYPSGGPVYPGGPTDPGYGQGSVGGHPGNRPPGSWEGHPGNRPPGSWSGEYPSGQPVPGGERPDNSLPELPQGGTDVPADEFQPEPPPEDIYSQVVVSVWDPRTTSWTTKSYPPR